MGDLIRNDGRKNLKILNLFGYTGGATLACAAAGAHVTHVDAAKGMVLWAKENLHGADADRGNYPVAYCRQEGPRCRAENGMRRKQSSEDSLSVYSRRSFLCTPRLLRI